MARIFLTGTGMITPAGRGAPETLSALNAGKLFFTRRAGSVPGDNDSRLPWPVAALAWPQIGWPQGSHWANNKKYANFAGHAAVAVAMDAVGGQLVSDPAQAERCGIVISVGSTNSQELGEAIQNVALIADGDARPLATVMFDDSPDFSYVRGIPSQVGQFVAMATGFRGSNVVVYGESSAGGLSALSFAARLIQSGELDRVMVVGIAPQLPAGTLAAMEQREALATQAVPGCGPFDAARAGMLLGESAVALVLEREGAFGGQGQRLAELLACETLSGLSRRQAAEFVVDAVLRQSSVTPQVWWAGACGGVEGDREECEAVAPHVRGVPVTSSKGCLGNAPDCGALIDVALAIASFGSEQVPPVGLLEQPDPALAGMDFVTKVPRPVPGLRSALITAMGGSVSTTAGAAVLARSAT
jgi:3-oxoacyl-[acyl-carrier-protein] synthase II